MSRILLVDIDRALTDTWRSELAADGHDVIVQTTGVDALRSARREPPDLLVVELMMPGGGGLALIGRLRLAGFDLKIIVTSGHPCVLLPSVDGLGLARRLGADLTFVKPLAPGTLRAAVHRLLSGAAEEAA